MPGFNEKLFYDFKITSESFNGLKKKGLKQHRRAFLLSFITGSALEYLIVKKGICKIN